MKSLKYLFLHFLHFSSILFPCNYDKLTWLKPERRCRPSVFWDTKYFSSFCFSSVTKAICVKEGIALFRSIIFLFSPSLKLFALFSQTPGPVLSTVFIPDRKSGIPEEVEIPAPVKEIKYLLYVINLATFFAFSIRTSGGSKYSTLSSSFRTVSVIWILILIIERG